MTNGNNNKNSYAKEAVLPAVATLEAKNFKVKYDFLNFPRVQYLQAEMYANYDINNYLCFSA